MNKNLALIKNHHQGYCGGIAALLMLLSANSFANSLNVSFGQLEQQVAVQDEVASLDPAGVSLSLSLDLAENWQVGLDYQHWQDDTDITTVTQNQRDVPFNVDSDLTTWGGSVGYYLDNWSFSGSYSLSEDDTLTVNTRRPSNFRSEDIRSSSLGGSVGYGWADGNWFYNVSGGVQYSDWDLDTKQISSQPPSPPGQGQGQGGQPPQSSQPNVLIEKTSNNATHLNASVSLARYWSLTEDTGVLVGGLLSWNHTVSGESALVSRNGRNNNPLPNNFGNGNGNGGGNNGGGNNGGVNNGVLRSLSGDDSYGQVSLYMSYDLTPSWSIDVDTAVDVSSEYSAQTWSVGLGYYF